MPNASIRDKDCAERVLGLFPDRRDAEFAVSVFADADIAFFLLDDPRRMAAEIDEGMGVLLLTSDALSAEDWERLAESLAHQPEWSALPIVCLVAPGTEKEALPPLLLPSEIFVIDQPVRVRSLVAVVRAALKSRRRQYQLRAKMQELEQEIVRRDRAEEELRRAKDELEARVRARTAELTRTVAELRRETEERVHAMEELRSRDQMLMQQSRLAAMGEMLANISHQWRQPLNLVGLLLQELMRSYDRDRLSRDVLEKNVSRARELIGHMSQTIDDFRNYLSPERKKAPFEVREVVEKAIELMGETLQDVRVELVEPIEPVTVEGYRNGFVQVVMNILMNARDVFRERKVAEPHLTLTLSRRGERCILTIADNAGGIPHHIMDRIFEPYFTTKPPDKGTGIGLFMSRNIIEKNMGGSLTVRNTGEGAEFRIEV